MRVPNSATGHLPFVDEFAVGWALLGLTGLVGNYFVQRTAARLNARQTPTIEAGGRALSLRWARRGGSGGGIVEATTVPVPVVSAVLFVTASCGPWRLSAAGCVLPCWRPLVGLLPVMLMLALLQPWRSTCCRKAGRHSALALASHGRDGAAQRRQAWH